MGLVEMIPTYRRKVIFPFAFRNLVGNGRGVDAGVVLKTYREGN